MISRFMSDGGRPRISVSSPGGIPVPRLTLRWIFMTVGVVMVGTIGVAPAGGAGTTETVPVGGVIPERVEVIEVISMEGHPSSVALLPMKPVPSPPRRRLDRRDENLLAIGEGVGSAGACSAVQVTDRESVRVRIRPAEPGACRIGLSLTHRDQVLDLLSGDGLRVRGSRVRLHAVTLGDRHGRQATVELPASASDGAVDQVVPLAAMGRLIDLRDVVSLIIALTPEQEGGELQDVTLVEPSLGARVTSKVGFWVWEYQDVVADPEPVIATCLAQACGRILLQMPSMTDPDDLWSRYAQTLARIQAATIEAYALDGYPEAIREPERLADKLGRLLSVTASRPPDGVQLDIEPYTLDGFAASQDGYARYVDTIRLMKNTVRGRTRLSIVMPFWFTGVMVEGRAVAFTVMETADEVAIMSYRTDVDELQAIGADALRYGDLIEIPVWLAVETRALPIEHHVRLQRVESRRLATAYLDRGGKRLVMEAPPPSNDGEWYRVVERSTVRPERLTYSGRSQAIVREAVSTLLRRVPNRSLAGILIHDLTGFRLLPPGERSER